MFSELDELTAAVENAAVTRNWDGAASLDARRRVVIEAVIAASSSPEERAEVAERLRGLLERDETVRRTLHQARREVRDELSGLNTSKRAGHAYARTTR